MNTIAFLPALLPLGLIIAGFHLQRRPPAPAAARRWIGPTLGASVLLFLAAQAGLLLAGIETAVAATDAASTADGIGLGTGLAMLGVGLPTALLTLAAALAVGPIGAASLAAVTEKPEVFGRTLVYLGLAEGIAIYGLVLSILMLDRL